MASPNDFKYCPWCKTNVKAVDFGDYKICEPCRAKLKKKKKERRDLIALAAANIPRPVTQPIEQPAIKPAPPIAANITIPAIEIPPLKVPIKQEAKQSEPLTPMPEHSAAKWPPLPKPILQRQNARENVTQDDEDNECDGDEEDNKDIDNEIDNEIDKDIQEYEKLKETKPIDIKPTQPPTTLQTFVSIFG